MLPLYPMYSGLKVCSSPNSLLCIYAAQYKMDSLLLLLLLCFANYNLYFFYYIPSTYYASIITIDCRLFVVAHDIIHSLTYLLTYLLLHFFKFFCIHSVHDLIFAGFGNWESSFGEHNKVRPVLLNSYLSVFSGCS